MVPTIQTDGDITLETVNSFLATNGIYKVSPLTGKAYSGAPLRYEILCLPTVYAWMSMLFKVAPEMVVTKIVPTVVLCASYMAYYLLAGVLYDEKQKRKKMVFLIVVGISFFLCEQSVYMEGYGLLHAGHLGTTIRNSVLIPLVLYAACEKRVLLAILCVLAEVCIVWTFWGMGLCLVVLAGALLAKGFIYFRGKMNKGGAA
jgi:hypothetical protein